MYTNDKGGKMASFMRVLSSLISLYKNITFHTTKPLIKYRAYEKLIIHKIARLPLCVPTRGSKTPGPFTGRCLHQGSASLDPKSADFTRTREAVRSISTSPRKDK